MIHEIHRKGDVTPLGLYHSATKDTELMGYSIPKVSCSNTAYILYSGVDVCHLSNLIYMCHVGS